MRILFSHNNFPAQFRRLAPALAEQGHDIVFWHKIVSGMLHQLLASGSRSTRSIVMAQEKLFIPTFVDSNHAFFRVKRFIALVSS